MTKDGKPIARSSREEPQDSVDVCLDLGLQSNVAARAFENSAVAHNNVTDKNQVSSRYKFGALLGRGGYASVWACTDKSTGQQFACKVVAKGSRKHDYQRLSIEKEIQVLRLVRGHHPGILNIHDVVETADVTCLVMELCRGGDLLELLAKKGKLPEHSAKAIFRQVASAVSFCHSRGIVHRDVKLENILLDRPGDGLYAKTPQSLWDVRTKLADFGLAILLEPGKTTKGRAGSKHYIAPEIIMQRRYGRRADVWSLGVVLCAMITGCLPFSGTSPSALNLSILQGKLDFRMPAWAQVSDEAIDLVHKMLRVDPKTRINSAEVLTHPWLTGRPLVQTCTVALQPTLTTVTACVSSMPIQRRSASLGPAPPAVHLSSKTTVSCPTPDTKGSGPCTDEFVHENPLFLAKWLCEGQIGDSHHSGQQPAIPVDVAEKALNSWNHLWWTDRTCAVKP